MCTHAHCQDGQGIFCGLVWGFFLMFIIFHLLTAEHGQWERLQDPLLSIVAPDALMRERIISLKKKERGQDESSIS